MRCFATPGDMHPGREYPELQPKREMQRPLSQGQRTKREDLELLPGHASVPELQPLPGATPGKRRPGEFEAPEVLHGRQFVPPPSGTYDEEAAPSPSKKFRERAAPPATSVPQSARLSRGAEK